MESKIFQDVSIRDREQYLKDNATKVEKHTYSKPLDVAEVSKLQTEFAQKAIELNIEESNLKEVREEFKSKTKPLKIEMAKLMQNIRTGAEEVTEDVYHLSDMDSEQMGYYNKEGVLIFSRPLMTSERQYSITVSNNLKKVNE